MPMADEANKVYRQMDVKMCQKCRFSSYRKRQFANGDVVDVHFCRRRDCDNLEEVTDFPQMNEPEPGAVKIEQKGKPCRLPALCFAACVGIVLFIRYTRSLGR